MIHRPLFIPLLAALVVSSRSGAEIVAIRDAVNYTKGCWGAYNSPWGAGRLVRDVDYADATTIDTAAFPNGGQIISWYWPKVPNVAQGVYSYNAIDYGDYDAGPVKGCVPPRQIKSIGTLKLSYAVKWTYTLGDFNLLAEMYAYSGPTSASTKIAEIGFLPRASTSALAYAKGGKLLGTFTDGSQRAWAVWQRDKYAMFVPSDQVTFGTLDFLGALNFLRSRKVLTGNEYFTGLGFGVEPTFGGGSLHIESLNVTYR